MGDWDYDEHRLPNHDFWRKADGNWIKITDMTDEHLANCARLLQRRGEFYSYPEVRKEMERRGVVSEATEKGERDE